MKKFTPLIIALLVMQSCAQKDTSTNVNSEIDTIENGLTTSIVIEGEKPVTYSIEERMDFYKVPGMSLAIVKNGKLHWAKGYGLANTNDSTKVTSTTLFQAGSISKPIAALAALKLVEEGKLDLDTNVNTYLKDWKVEENEFTKDEKVTVRRLLTHTAGMTVHGFPGYKPTDTFPSITQVLDGEGNTPIIFVDTRPDSIWRYSGGGYTVMEKVVEDVSGMPLEDYLKANILDAMEMLNSTYAQPLPEKLHNKVSAAYDYEGNIIKGLWHNYPEQAAAGLWTTPTDLAKYYSEVYNINNGKTDGVLSKTIIDKMLTKHKNNWGLGPALNDEGEALKFGHGGKNAGFTNNMVGFVNSGDAIIVMTNADNGGSLVEEVIRSASQYYNWNLAEPRTVSLAALGDYDLNPLLGKYLYTEEIPDIGKYYVHLSRDGEQLIIDNPNTGERDVMHAMDALSFIDVSDGDEMRFTMTKDSIGFLFNNRFQFYKVKE